MPPKLWRYARSRPFRARKPFEILVRVHDLGSIRGSSIGLFPPLFVPIEEGLGGAWPPSTAAPYFLLSWRDPPRAGYKFGDVPRVYAFNILLLPINIAGVAKSLRQAAWDGLSGRRLEAILLVSAAVMLGYALVAFVDVRAGVEDISFGVRGTDWLSMVQTNVTFWGRRSNPLPPAATGGRGQLVGTGRSRNPSVTTPSCRASLKPTCEPGTPTPLGGRPNRRHWAANVDGLIGTRCQCPKTARRGRVRLGYSGNGHTFQFPTKSRRIRASG